VVNRLQPQLKNAEEIKGVLKEISMPFQLHDGRVVRTLIVYLPIEDGKSSHSKFFEVVRDGLIANFVFSCSEVEKKLGVKNSNSAEELFKKAIRKLSKHTAKGELGELILFALLDVYFQAPKILSKVSLKTSPKMPVYGADAVHGQFENGKFKLYLGEAKLHKKFKPAAKDAADSMKKAKDAYAKEFDLLDSYMDFPDIDDELETELLALLNPFSNKNVSELIHSPCFIGFTEAELISQATSEQEFMNNYILLAGDYIADFFSKTESIQLSIDEVSLLMLPFSCIDELEKEFIEYMGIEE
tara:strand:- start:87964 stop:88863 length:900 start_codon:yes stop_codon:yes gene_type:complete